MNLRPLDARALRDWPLPEVGEDADKEERGRVVVVGGSREIAGAAQLAGVAALRAGAGKLVIGTAASAAPHLGQAVPEARVIGLPENDAGSLRTSSIAAIAGTLEQAAAVLVGPGMMDPQGTVAFVEHLLRACRGVPVVLDASAMDVVQAVRRFEQPVLLTPHAGEMAHLTGIAKEEVAREPASVALRAAAKWNATVALKGATTHIATPRGELWRHEGGHPGLGTSGSGDVLAGLIAGFTARGAPLEQACAWGVVVHGLAGRVLARRVGGVGYLARELAGVVPQLLEKTGRPLRRSPAPRAR